MPVASYDMTVSVDSENDDIDCDSYYDCSGDDAYDHEDDEDDEEDEPPSDSFSNYGTSNWRVEHLQREEYHLFTCKLLYTYITFTYTVSGIHACVCIYVI